MKKFILSIILALLSMVSAKAQEAYAVYTNDGTLTFYYDNQRNTREGDKYDMNIGYAFPTWKYEHSTDIIKVVFDASFSNARPTSTSNWFSVEWNETSNLVKIEGINNLRTDNVTKMYNMFSRCGKISNIDVSRFNTENVVDMRGMFSYCISLKRLDVSHFDTKNVTDMNGMFYECNDLEELDLTHFDTSNVTNMGGMFFKCLSLQHLDLSSFNTHNVFYMNWMFQACNNLVAISVGNDWSTDNVIESSYMFTNCYKIVGGEGTTYNSNNTDVSYAHIDGGPSNPGYLTGTTSLAKSLQERLDGLTPGVHTVIDLTAEGYTGELDDAIYVRGGIDVKFVNGTLTTDFGFKVTDNSKLELGSQSIIEGYMASGTGNSFDGRERFSALVYLAAGSLEISEGGKVINTADNSSYNKGFMPKKVIYAINYKHAVELADNGGSFTLYAGTIDGSIGTEDNTSISIEGGEVTGAIMDGNYATNETSTLTMTGGIVGEIAIKGLVDIYISGTAAVDLLKIYGNTTVSINGGTIKKIYTKKDVTFPGNANVEEVALFDGENVIWLTSALNHTLRVGCCKGLDDVVVKGKNYTLTQQDRSNIDAFSMYDEDDDLRISENCSDCGAWWEYERLFLFEINTKLQDNAIVYARKGEKVCDSDDLQRFLEQMAGIETETDVPLCDEPTIDDDVEVDDIQIWIDGTDQEPPLVIGFYGGTINIHQNAGMSFKGVSFASKNNAKESSLRTIGNGGGISNSGTLRFENCTFQSGGYTIENNGETYINAGVAGCRLTNKRGGRIHITSPLTDELTVTVPAAADVEQGVAIITGVSNTDHIQMSLPSGYTYKYDSTAGGIVVYSTTGITSVEQQVTVKESFDATGRKVKNNRIGLTIQRMSDGMVKKVIINQ